MPEDPLDLGQQLVAGLRSRRESLDVIYIPDIVEWIDKLGVKVDGRTFDWDNHQYLRMPYREERAICVVMKAAQMGFSIWAMLRMLKRTLQLAPIKVGYFLPTSPKAVEFSQDRFDPMCRAIPKLAAIYQGGNIRNVHIKQYGGSTVFFQHMGGIASLESTPLDYQIFDEVRKMSRTDIATARERLSHSQYAFIDYISTAGLPDEDINYYFKRSTQTEWVISCPSCNHEFMPHEDWESLRCVDNRKLPGEDRVRWALVCPHCGQWDIDAQANGRWVELFPTRDWAGYHVSQLISRYITLDRIMEEWFSAENRAEFWRSKLGLPFVDAETILVQQAHLDASVNTELKWGVEYPLTPAGWRKDMDNRVTVMGCDQQQGFNVIVIKEVLPNGHKNLLHLEYVYDGKPFRRTAQLMKEFDIDACVVDAEPNYNEATEFCRAFRTRAWMAYYSSAGGEELVIWHDLVAKKELASTKEARMPWHCTIDRVTGMEHSLLLWEARRNSVPDPHRLIQQMRPRDLLDPTQAQLTSGKMVSTPICSEVYFKHLQKLAKERVAKTKDGIEIVGQAQHVFVNIGIDPHFAHANLYADMAALRAVRRTRGGDIVTEEPEKPKDINAPPTKEVAPGVNVAMFAKPQYQDLYAEVRCPKCGKLYEWHNTRAMIIDGEEARVCLNCMGKKGKPVDHIVEYRKRVYNRAPRPDDPDDDGTLN